MNLHRPLFTSLAALVGVAALFALRAGGQVSPDGAKAPPTVVEVGPNNTLIERTPDGKVLRTTTREANAAAWVPYTSADGRTFYAQPGYGHRYLAGDTPHAQDAESQKLMAEEQAAAQEARKLSAQAQQADSDGEKADAKKKLRDKLSQVFDLQQQRRTREIAKIEERLGKLKETLKKRDSAKDSIVDRRLEAITGGVDELGWEESFPTQATPYGYPVPNPPNTTTVPRAEPRLAPPGRDPFAPAGTIPVPSLSPDPFASPVPPAAAPAAPPVAPAPVALPVPAAPRR